jgi:5-carboxymethyl-2-hydroxymuconate isomerase
MPHFNIEYSANLEAELDMTTLCRLVHATLLESGLFELGAVRVRAKSLSHYAITDLLPENAFVDMVLRMGEGRSEEDRKALGEAIFAAVSLFCADRLAEPHFALSLEIREIDARLSWKKNSMHPRLRKS